MVFRSQREGIRIQIIMLMFRKQAAKISGTLLTFTCQNINMKACEMVYTVADRGLLYDTNLPWCNLFGFHHWDLHSHCHHHKSNNLEYICHWNIWTDCQSMNEYSLVHHSRHHNHYLGEKCIAIFIYALFQLQFHRNCNFSLTSPPALFKTN